MCVCFNKAVLLIHSATGSPQGYCQGRMSLTRNPRQIACTLISFHLSSMQWTLLVDLIHLSSEDLHKEPCAPKKQTQTWKSGTLSLQKVNTMDRSVCGWGMKKLLCHKHTAKEPVFSGSPPQMLVLIAWPGRPLRTLGKHIVSRSGTEKMVRKITLRSVSKLKGSELFHRHGTVSGSLQEIRQNNAFSRLLPCLDQWLLSICTSVPY